MIPFRSFIVRSFSTTSNKIANLVKVHIYVYFDNFSFK